jgi:glycine hydroxymethyltransferase
MNNKLKETDNDIYNLINEEKERQKNSLELIASENYTSKAVMECLGSILTNKYSEGMCGSRYYGGNIVIDKIEKLCMERALKAYRLDKTIWGVNVQPYSGSPANLAVFNGILNPHDRIMGLDLPSGGHLTHGFYTSKKKISATSVYYESLGYHIKENGYIDYDELEKLANYFKPKLIICGYSAYPRDLDYKRFRKIADNVNAYLMCDMAHFSGLVVTEELKSPFDYCDIVTTTTHKTLRGPRSGMIFYKLEYKKNIDQSVFPGLQGGPHNHQIAGLAVQLKEVMKPEFKEYIIQVKKNIKALSEELIKLGYSLSTNGTENHLLLMNLRPLGLTGSKVEKLCELCNISLNKNTVYGDKSALSPSGIRIGSSSLTTRGLKEKDFRKIAIFLHEIIKLALEIQSKSGKKLKDFNLYLNNDYVKCKLNDIKDEVLNFIKNFEYYN